MSGTPSRCATRTSACGTAAAGRPTRRGAHEPRAIRGPQGRAAGRVRRQRVRHGRVPRGAALEGSGHAGTCPRAASERCRRRHAGHADREGAGRSDGAVAGRDRGGWLQRVRGLWRVGAGALARLRHPVDARGASVLQRRGRTPGVPRAGGAGLTALPVGLEGTRGLRGAVTLRIQIEKGHGTMITNEKFVMEQYERRIAKILEERDRDERILIEALQDMLDTALQSDDTAWAAGIERAGTDKPCDKAAAAIAYVVGAGMRDGGAHSYRRAAARKQERARERTRLEVER